MASTRINGIPMNLEQLTAYELDALLEMAQGRIASANCDIAKIYREQLRREQHVLDLNK